MTRSKAVAVFGSSQTERDSPSWIEAEHVGQRLARSSLAVITGGYGGTMEAVSKGASEEGGHVIGITAPPLFPGRHGANPFVDELIEAESLAARIGKMIDRAVGALALPGSIGTATELLFAWNINHIVRRNGGLPVPTCAVGPGWDVVATTLAKEIDAVPADIHLAPDIANGMDWLLAQL